MSSWDVVQSTLQNDLSAAVGAPVRVNLHTLVEQPETIVEPWSSAEVLDGQVIDVSTMDPDPKLLQVGDCLEDVYLVSHLLRSLCPVTGQPDWGSVFIHYRGNAIGRAGLLKYLVGYRKHQEFHEQCVERIYRDIWQQCKPEELSVYARYVRRGGLDINPYRSSESSVIGNWRLIRQ
jgi:7-cyano-7-deazaguanine reductase